MEDEIEEMSLYEVRFNPCELRLNPHEIKYNSCMMHLT